MKKRWICSGILIAASLMILIGMCFNYIKVDFSGVGEQAVSIIPDIPDPTGIVGKAVDAIRDIIDTQVRQIVEAVSGKQGMVLSFSGIGMIGKMGSWARQLGYYNKVASALRWLMVAVIVPCLFALLVLAFSFVRRRWGYVVSLCVSCTGLFATLFSILYVVPHVMYQSIMNIRISEVCEKIVELSGGQFVVKAVLEELIKAFSGQMDLAGTDTIRKLSGQLHFNEGVMRRFVVRGLGPAYWIGVAGFAIAIGASLAGILVSHRAKSEASGRRDKGAEITGESEEPWNRPLRIPPGGFNKTYAARGKNVRTAAEPGIRCAFGPLANVTIPLAEGDRLILGRDPGRCSLVADVPKLANVHCSILWNQATGDYTVIAQDSVYADGQQLPLRKGIPLPGGTTIYLGDIGNGVKLL